MKKVIPKAVPHRKSQTPLVHNILTWELSESGLVLTQLVTPMKPSQRTEIYLPTCDIKIIENLYIYVVYPNKYIVSQINRSECVECLSWYICTGHKMLIWHISVSHVDTVQEMFDHVFIINFIPILTCLSDFFIVLLVNKQASNS